MSDYSFLLAEYHIKIIRKGRFGMEQLEQTSKKPGRYDIIYTDFSAQVDFITKKQHLSDAPLMRLQLLLRKWAENEPDSKLKDQLKKLDETIIQFYNENLSKDQLTKILFELKQVLLEKKDSTC